MFNFNNSKKKPFKTLANTFQKTLTVSHVQRKRGVMIVDHVAGSLDNLVSSRIARSLCIPRVKPASVEFRINRWTLNNNKN